MNSRTPISVSERRSPLDDSEATERQRSLARRCSTWTPGLLPALYLIAWAALLLAVFAGLGYFLTHVGAHDVIGRTDHATERWFARDRTSDLNQITHYTTYLGETITVILIGLVLAVVARLLWKRWREPALVVVALVGEVSIFVMVTLLIDRNRPRVPHLDAAPPTSSFPSGHTAASIVLYFLIALLVSYRVRSGALRYLVWTLAVLLPLLVALSRLYRGMHYPTDVASGALLGGTWLFTAVRGVRLGALQRHLRDPATPREERR